MVEDELTAYIQDHSYRVQMVAMRKYREKTENVGLHTLPKVADPDRLSKDDYWEDLEEFIGTRIYESTRISLEAQKLIKLTTTEVEIETEPSLDFSQLSDLFKSKRASQSRTSVTMRIENTPFKKEITSFVHDDDVFADDFKQSPDYTRHQEQMSWWDNSQGDFDAVNIDDYDDLKDFDSKRPKVAR